MIPRKLLLFSSLVSLCGFGVVEPLLLTGVTANWLFNEPRPISGILEDKKITYCIRKQLSKDPKLHMNTHVNPIVYNQIVVLTGQVSNEILKQQVDYHANHTPKVKRVFNQLIITSPTSKWRRIQDVILRKRIQAKLLFTSYVRFHHFTIFVENGSVFVFGKSDASEAQLVITAIQHTPGVEKIIKMIEPA
jgi:osmotically-inducible protein OsmY